MSFNQQANSQQTLAKKLAGVDLAQKPEATKFDTKEIGSLEDTSRGIVELHNRREGGAIYSKAIWGHDKDLGVGELIEEP